MRSFVREVSTGTTRPQEKKQFRKGSKGTRKGLSKEASSWCWEVSRGALTRRQHVKGHEYSRERGGVGPSADRVQVYTEPGEQTAVPGEASWRKHGHPVDSCHHQDHTVTPGELERLSRRRENCVNTWGWKCGGKLWTTSAFQTGGGSRKTNSEVQRLTLPAWGMPGAKWKTRTADTEFHFGNPKFYVPTSCGAGG